MTLQEYVHLVTSQGAECVACGRSLKGRPVVNYDHPEGWRVKGFDELQWIYFVCTCRYQTSLAKLGIARPEPV